MRKALPLLLLAAAGCGRAEAWKDKYIREVNAHYQTQLAKNAEIAALKLEIENYRYMNETLEDRIDTLQSQVRELEGAPRLKRPETPNEAPKGPTPPSRPR